MEHCFLLSLFHPCRLVCEEVGLPFWFCLFILFTVRQNHRTTGIFGLDLSYGAAAAAKTFIEDFKELTQTVRQACLSTLRGQQTDRRLLAVHPSCTLYGPLLFGTSKWWTLTTDSLKTCEGIPTLCFSDFTLYLTLAWTIKRLMLVFNFPPDFSSFFNLCILGHVFILYIYLFLKYIFTGIRYKRKQ